MELVAFHFNQVNVYCVCKQNNGFSSISHLSSLSVGLTAEIYRNKTVLANYAFSSLLVLYAALLPDLYFWSKSCVLYSNFNCTVVTQQSHVIHVTMHADRECRGWQSEQGCNIPTGRSVLEFQTTRYVARLSVQSGLCTSGSQSSSVYDPTYNYTLLLMTRWSSDWVVRPSIARLIIIQELLQPLDCVWNDLPTSLRAQSNTPGQFQIALKWVAGWCSG